MQLNYRDPSLKKLAFDLVRQKTSFAIVVEDENRNKRIRKLVAASKECFGLASNTGGLSWLRLIVAITAVRGALPLVFINALIVGFDIRCERLEKGQMAVRLIAPPPTTAP